MLYPGYTHHLSKKAILILVALGLLVSSLIGFSCYTGLLPFHRVDNLYYDWFLKIKATGKVPKHVMVVDIDDASLAAVGQWPWPRYKMAALVSTLAEMKPAAIGLDILFAEPDRTSLASIKENYKRDFGLDIAFQGVPAGLTDNDGYLGHVLGKTGTVGAHYFYFDHMGSGEGCHQQKLQLLGESHLLRLHDAKAVLCNTKAIDGQLRYSGFINNQLDDDGMLRRIPILLQYGGTTHPSLALATLLRSLGINRAELVDTFNGPLLQFGSYSIPLSTDGFAQLCFNGPSNLMHTVSALDLFNQTVQPEEVQRKIIVIGSSAIGLNDFVPTAFDAMFPGMQIHAMMAENVLEGQYIIKPVWSRKVILGASLVTGVLMSALFVLSSGPLLLLSGTTILGGLALLLSLALFYTENLFVSPGEPIFIAAFLFALFSVARFTMEKREAFQWYKKLSNAQQLTMESMATVAETRDPETGAHIQRTQHYVRAVGEQLFSEGKYRDIIDQEYIDLLFVSAPLHDIGKVGVPDHILLKPGKLSDEEFEEMKKHTEYGRKIIASTVRKIEGDNFLQIAGEIAAAHHEKWDGSGYPHGLAGEDIPLSGRIMAVADVYDALTSKRCYKPPFSHEKAKDIILEGSGKAFDPAVVAAFFTIEEAIIEIAQKIREPES
jgi:adenylate cyclase